MAPYISLPSDGRDSHGFWGMRTATIDWCEENYIVSSYIAEFWNTISCLMMIIPPLVAVQRSRGCGFDKVHHYMYIGLFVVGVGSWLFHGTLYFSMQLMDELPMIWASTFLIYGLYQVDSPPKVHNYGLAIGLAIYSFVVSVVYVIWQEAIFHEVCYGLMVVATIVLAVRLNQRYDYVYRESIFASAIYLLGFAIWNLENRFCYYLRPFRASCVWYLQPFLQGHCWWHICAGIGTYMGITIASYGRRRFLQQPAVYKYKYYIFPYVDTKDTGSGIPHSRFD